MNTQSIKRIFTIDHSPPLWRTLLLIAILSLGIYYTERHILVTVSASLDHRWFWRTGEPPARGDYATFLLLHPLAGDRPVRLSKRLVCWEGDVLKVIERDYFCSASLGTEVSLGTAKETGLNGQPLPQFRFNGVVPAGMAFAAGTHVDSFDSRYWGFVVIASTERLIPLF